MRVHVEIDGRPLPAEVPFQGADHVVVEGSCPRCGVAPLKVRGRGVEARTHDSEIATAGTLCCGEAVGQIVATFSTIFGIDEDRAVLVHGRARVY